ncbi:hypothetical protein ABB37_08432 [Leptomonas pyrrhocoris]|uniref:Uncharacterized protein n=1 Tax=Leptomonas pyrrhocoris TaxID=157538 RepID=A0A0N0DS37_LEPPY|nr:hypothetical protein ABB37_08432 [Leptomonas pyrrhocoris]KPA75542.1 hypothetical protein ABB37_08432 [Leptomonas pyrrhocoris]|eukprot:XP_015653981.1 hypothetical protein ABB37_08432 [Leptomonas pyrrhocoris]
MGCGISQSVLRGNDDVSKSDAFIRLCTNEKSPLAMQLSGYFNALISECLYKSQGDMNGYERVLAKRPTEISVNHSRLAAQRHGIGHKPLTVDGVNDIMNLFLGHAIKSLEKRKWSGTFNFALMQPTPTVGIDENGNSNADRPYTNSRNGSPWKSAVRKNNSSRSRKKNAVVDVAAADPPTDLTETPLRNPLQSKRSAFTVSSSALGNSDTRMFVDDGSRSRRDDDPSLQWRMELTGNITYPSIDGALTLICDCTVAFLFFTCDADLLPSANSFSQN